MTTALSHPDYPAFLAALKERILHARISGARAVNRELVLLYWDIGRRIVEKQQTAGWGDAVVQRLAADLRAAFPDLRGFSADNLWRIRQFFAEYSGAEFLEQAVPELRGGRRSSSKLSRAVRVPAKVSGQFLEQAAPETPGSITDAQAPEFLAQTVRDLVVAVPWGHHIELLKKVKAPAAFDLKIGPFEPEHAGKMDFYLNLLNNKERSPDDQPSIGIILCAEKDDVEVEFALKTKTNPIGVAEYQLLPKLPTEFKGRLPTARQLADAVRDVIPPEK